MGKKVAYAVKKGRQTGIFSTWEQASKHVQGFPGAIYKGFSSMEEAQAFMGNAPASESSQQDDPAPAGGGRHGVRADSGISSPGEPGHFVPPRVGSDGTPMITFGKHRGKSFKDVAAAHPEYVAWAQKQADASPALGDFVQWCRKHGALSDASSNSMDEFGSSSTSSDHSAESEARKRKREDAGSKQDGDTFRMFFDGGSRNNGTPRAVAGSGAVIYRGPVKLWSAGRFLGKVTNNVAEYDGLILGLEGASKLGARKLVIKGDSKLVVNQVQGLWRCNFPHLETMLRDARAKMGALGECRLEHVLRAENPVADALANRAMDARADFEEEHTPEEAEREARAEEDDLIDPAARRARVHSRGSTDAALGAR